MPIKKKQRNNNKKKKKKKGPSNSPVASATPNTIGTRTQTLDGIMKEVSLAPTSSSSSSLLKRQCYHGSNAKAFLDGSNYKKVAAEYLALIMKLQHGCFSNAEIEEARLEFDLKHKKLITDVRFCHFLFAFATTKYLAMHKNDETTKLEVQMFLQLGFKIKYGYLLRRSLGKEFEYDKIQKYGCDIFNGDERGIINCLFRETKEFCDCMKQKKMEALTMEKMERCSGCMELFPKKIMKKCEGCNMMVYHSTACYQKYWPTHRNYCKFKQESVKVRDGRM